MSGFLEEARRRKVYRVAAAYVVVAGGAIQLASAVFPAWDLPTWALRLVIVLLLIGFPISLILAWALEVTPEGIRSTPEAPAAPRRSRNVVALVAVGIIVSAAAGFFLLPRASVFKIDKSIAVLAEVYAIVGESDKALALADGLLSRTSQLTVATLKMNPVWDPIRQDPRFITLIRKHGG